jgi:hypothetical protein
MSSHQQCLVFFLIHSTFTTHLSREHSPPRIGSYSPILLYLPSFSTTTVNFAAGRSKYPLRNPQFYYLHHLVISWIH